MTVKDIVSKIVDNYYKIVIEVFDPETHLIKTRHEIRPHNVSDRLKIMENAELMENEVGMIIPHLDSLVIAVEQEVK